MKTKKEAIYQSIGYHFEDQLPFPVLKGLGRQHVTSPSYYWNNEKRGDSQCVIQYTISGFGILEYQGKVYEQHPGSVFSIVIPDKNLYYLPESSDHWDFIYLEFSMEALPIFSQIVQFSGPSFSISHHPDFVRNLFHIYQNALSNSITTFADNSKLCYQVLMDLLVIAEQNRAKKEDRLDEAKQYIDTHYHISTLNLDDIADSVGLSKYHIARSFHKKFGMTVFKYINHRRIEQACRLLKQSNQLTSKQIAEMVGFSSDNYFGKNFKKIKGMTPNTYRKQGNQYDLVRIIYKDKN